MMDSLTAVKIERFPAMPRALGPIPFTRTYKEAPL